MSETREAVSKESIKEWIISYVAQLIGVPKSGIQTNITFDEFGLDSTAAAGLSGDLSDWLGVHLEVNLTKQYRTIDEIANHVAELVGVT